MTSSHITAIIIAFFIVAGSVFFVGKEHGRQEQAEQYAGIVSQAVEILIRGRDN